MSSNSFQYKTMPGGVRQRAPGLLEGCDTFVVMSVLLHRLSLSQSGGGATTHKMPTDVKRTSNSSI
jgi:hypothetical protein